MIDKNPPLYFIIDAQKNILAGSIYTGKVFEPAVLIDEHRYPFSTERLLAPEEERLQAALETARQEQMAEWKTQRLINQMLHTVFWSVRLLNPASPGPPQFLLSVVLAAQAEEAARPQSEAEAFYGSAAGAYPARVDNDDIYRASFMALSTPALLWKRDEFGEIRLAQLNPAADAFDRGGGHELVGLNVEDVFERMPQMANYVQETLRTGQPQISEQVYTLRLSGEERWITFETQRLDDDYVFSLMRDITSDKNKLLKEETSRGKIELLRQAMTAFTSVLNLQQLEDRVLDYLSRLIPFDKALVFLLSQTEVECIAEAGFDEHPRFIGQRFPAANPQFEALNRNRTPLYLSNAEEYRPFKTLGELNCGKSWLGVPLLIHGQMIGYMSIYNDTPDYYGAPEADLALTFASEVSIAVENARLFEQLQKMAVTDDLTGLYNRRHFYELGEIELRRSRRYRNPLTVLMIDVDNFKKVNDQHGHSYGDQVLVMLSQCMRTAIREVDLLGRYGGEEFVVLLPETALDPGLEAAERLRSAVEHCLVTEEIRVTVSVGIASLDETCHTIDDLLQRADQALYRAKIAGKNCVSR